MNKGHTVIKADTYVYLEKADWPATPDLAIMCAE